MRSTAASRGENPGGMEINRTVLICTMNHIPRADGLLNWIKENYA